MREVGGHWGGAIKISADFCRMGIWAKKKREGSASVEPPDSRQGEEGP